MQSSNQPPRRKRSSRLTLALMGAAGSVATLAGCGQDPAPQNQLSDVNFTEPKAYQNVDECVADQMYTQKACEAAFNAAIEAVPRYDSMAACEEVHGEGACEPPPQSVQQNQGGSWFGPALMGYMVGNMMANRNGARVQSLYHEPVYRTRENRGNWNSASSAATSRVEQRNQAFRTSVNQRATQRSGFGSRSSARGGFGS
ncbi:DUF1190 domain-containing protein [Vreelandella aquamarina]